MEQARPLPKGKSPVTTLLSGEAGGKASQLSDLSVLEEKLSNGGHRGSAPPINPLTSLEKAPREKTPKRNFESTLLTRDYGCKYCEAKFGSLQSLGGHQNAHRHERAARKRARVMTRIANALSRANLKSNPNCSGMEADTVPGYSIAYGPRTRPLPPDVVGPATANQLNGIVYQPMDNGDPNFGARVSPQTTGPRPPLANVLANGSSFSAQEIVNEGLDLTLRL